LADVFLTGGTGLVGSHVAARLQEKGWGVRALCRRGADTSFLHALGCRLEYGDLFDSPQRLRDMMAGCRAVVHAAAEVYVDGTRERLRASNVESTRRVFTAAAEAGVRRGVHFSSVAVYGTLPGPIREESGRTGRLNPKDHYGQTKRAAEEVVEELHGTGGLELTILRPPALFGERDRRITHRLARALKRRVLFLPGRGQNRLALAYAGNVAAAVDPALTGPSAGGDVFNVTEDTLVTPRSLFLGLGRELGIRPYLVNVPGWMVGAGASLAETLGLGLPGAPGLSLRRAARLALEDNPYPSEKAREVLGWQPPFTLCAALARTGAWLRQRGNMEKEALNA